MAANDINPRSHGPSTEEPECLAPSALQARLREEISRAERLGSGLSCLLVKFDNLEQLAREHGDELREQTIAYVAHALGRELRSFDRVGRLGDGHDRASASGDLVIVLPGADGPRGEIVARRALERLRTIKVEAGGVREALEISVGLAAWRADVSAESLLDHARAAVRTIDAPAV